MGCQATTWCPRKKFLGYKLVVFGAHVFSIDPSRWFYCKSVDRIVFHISTTIAPPCMSRESNERHMIVSCVNKLSPFIVHLLYIICPNCLQDTYLFRSECWTVSVYIRIIFKIKSPWLLLITVCYSAASHRSLDKQRWRVDVQES